MSKTVPTVITYLSSWINNEKSYYHILSKATIATVFESFIKEHKIRKDFTTLLFFISLIYLK